MPDFFPQTSFTLPFPPEIHAGVKTNFSVSFLILCTDHRQLSLAVLEKS